MRAVPRRRCPNTASPSRRPGSRRQAGPVPYVYGLSIAAAIRKLEKAGFTVERQLRVQRLGRRPAASSAGHRAGLGRRVRHHLPRSRKGRDPAIAASDRGRRPRRPRKKPKKAEEKQQKPREKKASREDAEKGSGGRRRRGSARRAGVAPRPPRPPPSALPLVCGVTTPITLPMPFSPSSAAPVWRSRSATIALISSAPSWLRQVVRQHRRLGALLLGQLGRGRRRRTPPPPRGASSPPG